MKFCIKMVMLLPFLILGMACSGPTEVHGVELPQATGTAEFAQARCGFNVTFNYISCKNLSAQDMKIEIHRRKDDDSYVHLHTSSIVELPIGSGQTVTYSVSSISLGDIIEIDVWTDSWGALFDEFLNDAPPDYIKETVIIEGDMGVSDSIKRERYDVEIDDMVVGSGVAGAACVISGIRYVEVDTKQDNNVLYCRNDSSNAVRVQLFRLQHDGGGNYSDIAELVDFNTIPQVGEDEDLDQIFVDFSVGELLALKVTKNVLNPLDVEVYGFTMDHTTGMQTELIGTIDVP